MFSPIQKPKKVFAPFFKNRKKCVPTVGKLGPGTRQVLPPSLRTFTDFHFFHLWLIDCGSKEEKYRGILPHLRWVLFRSRIEGWYGRKWIKTPGLDLDCPKKLPDTIFFWVSESSRLRYIILLRFSQNISTINNVHAPNASLIWLAHFPAKWLMLQRLHKPLISSQDVSASFEKNFNERKKDKLVCLFSLSSNFSSNFITIHHAISRWEPTRSNLQQIRWQIRWLMLTILDQRLGSCITCT